MDMVNINNYWQHQNPPLFYSQVPPQGQADTGERLTKGGFNGPEVRGPDGRPLRQPALGTEALGQMGKELGMKGQFILSNTAMDGNQSAEGVKKVSSFAAFSEALKNGDGSMVVMVNSRDKLFTGMEDKGGAGGGHVISASDYRPGPPEMVFQSNQWGSGGDGWVKLTDLYNATLPSGSNQRVDASGQIAPGQRTENGNAQPNWSSNDQVWRDEPYREWRQNLIDQNKKDKEPSTERHHDKDKDKDKEKEKEEEKEKNLEKHQSDKKSKADHLSRIAGLMSLLADAEAHHDRARVHMLERKISRIKESA